jgi:hypothetical protein
VAYLIVHSCGQQPHDSSSTRAIALVRLVVVVYHDFCWWRRARVLGVEATQSNFFDHPSSANLEAWSNPKTGSFDRPPETLWALG